MDRKPIELSNRGPVLLRKAQRRHDLIRLPADILVARALRRRIRLVRVRTAVDIPAGDQRLREVQVALLPRVVRPHDAVHHPVHNRRVRLFVEAERRDLREEIVQPRPYSRTPISALFPHPHPHPQHSPGPE